MFPTVPPQASKPGKYLFLGNSLVVGDQSQDRVERAHAQGVMLRDRQPLMCGNVRLQNDVAAHLVNDPVIPIFAEVLDQGAPRKIPRQFHASGQGEALVADQVQAHTLRLRLRRIKEVAFDRLIHRLAQFRPCIALRDNRLRQAFRDESTIHLLRHLKNQIAHAANNMAVRPFKQPRVSHPCTSAARRVRPELRTRSFGEQRRGRRVRRPRLASILAVHPISSVACLPCFRSPLVTVLLLLSAFTFQLSSLSWAQTKSKPKPDPFAKLATDLAEDTPSGEVNIGVGNFAYENTDLLSPFSSMLRDELEIALGETGKFKVVTRDRLADLQMEGKFQGKGVLEPGSGVEKVSIQGVKGIVRGRFYATGDEVTIFAELAWLEGGEIKKTRLSIPSEAVKAKIWPDPDQAAGKQLAGAIKPQNMEQSLANIQDIAGSRLADVPKDFQVEVFTTDGKRAYAEGETVSFRVRASEECHIAVLCHQTDGTTVVLFPNRYASNTLIPPNKPIDVPGTHKSGFEIVIGPPFGSDVVEVIACSKPSELHKSLAEHAARAEEQQPVQVLTRGMAVKGIDSALSTPKTGDGAPLRWGQDSIVVSTFPKP